MGVTHARPTSLSEWDRVLGGAGKGEGSDFGINACPFDYANYFTACLTVTCRVVNRSSVGDSLLQDNFI